MRLDNNLMFSDQQAVTATAPTADTFDNGAAPTLRDPGAGSDDLRWIVLCTETATALGAATVNFTLESDAAADLSSAPTVHDQTGPIAKANLTKGTIVAKRKLPLGDYQRYLGGRYTVANGPLTAGKFTFFVLSGVDAQRYYPAASVIS